MPQRLTGSPVLTVAPAVRQPHAPTGAVYPVHVQTPCAAWHEFTFLSETGENHWLLATGFWWDSKLWLDTDLWKDGP